MALQEFITPKWNLCCEVIAAVKLGLITEEGRHLSARKSNRDCWKSVEWIHLPGFIQP
ncbi:hypothetical protein AB0758_33320 [Tolypothrix bouteillei VB521301_2]|uniref:hypothetical protein n=1 Tax=Tolypothrix bouteillei TaxID=1246981 RepID=UPI0038B66A14